MCFFDALSLNAYCYNQNISMLKLVHRLFVAE